MVLNISGSKASILRNLIPKCAYLLKTNLHCNYFLKETITLKGAIEAHRSSRMLAREEGLEKVMPRGTVDSKVRDPFKQHN